MHPIVAPPPKHPIMYPIPNSADGTGDTLLTTGRFTATMRVRVRVRVRARARGRVRGRGRARARARLGSDQRRLSRRKYAIQDGIGNPVTIAAKPRVEIVMKVTITPTKRTEGPTKRLRMCKGWVVAAFSNVHVSPRHVIASPLPP